MWASLPDLERYWSGSTKSLAHFVAFISVMVGFMSGMYIHSIIRGGFEFNHHFVLLVFSATQFQIYFRLLLRRIKINDQLD